MNNRSIMRSLASILVLLFGLSFSAWADYVAYANVDKRRIPLPKDVDGIEAKYLVNMSWGRANTAKLRVGVLMVQNTSGASTGASGDGSEDGAAGGAPSGTVPVQGIEAIVTTIMQKSGRFRVFERSAMKAVLREQDLGTSGRISKPSAAKVGKLLGVQYLVKVEVTHYEPNYKGKGFGLSGVLRRVPILGGLKKGGSKSMVGMNFRLINATTGEVVFTKQIKSIISQSGLSLNIRLPGIDGGDARLSGFFKTFSRTPIGQAVIATVNKGVFALVKQIGATPVKGAVSRVKGRQVYLNLGQGRVRVGDRLKVMSKGEKVVDPTTGEVLGSEDEQIGMVIITRVRKRYSIARISGPLRGRIKIRDEVIALRSPEPLQYAPGWQGPGGGSRSSGSSNTSPSNGSDEDEDEGD